MERLENKRGQTYTFHKMFVKRPGGYEMKGFTPTAESHGFSPELLWSGCRSTKPRRS